MSDDNKKSNDSGSSDHHQSRLESVETIGDSGHAPLPPLQFANDVEQQQHQEDTNIMDDDAIKKSAMSGIRSAMNNNQRVQQVHHVSSGFSSSRVRTTRPRNDAVDRSTAVSSSSTTQQPSLHHNNNNQNISPGSGVSVDENDTLRSAPNTIELVPLDAVVVEEEVDVPVYDGVVVQPDDEQQEVIIPCYKRKQKCLVIVFILVIVAMASIVGGILGTQSNSDTNKNEDLSSVASGEILVASSTTSAPSTLLIRKSTSLPSLSPSSSFLPTSSTPTLQPISAAPTKPLYYADWSNRRCSNDPENKPSSNLGQQLYERVEDCCTAAFYYLTGYNCILASLDITQAPTSSPTTRSPTTRPTYTPSSSPLSPTSHPTTSLRPTNGSSPPSMYLPSLEWVQVGQSILGEGSNDWAGRSVSLSKDGLVLAVGASRHDNTNGNNAGHVQIYTLVNGDAWQKFGNFIEGDQTGDWFGHSVSLSGDGLRIAVGAQYADSGNGLSSGKVQVYEYDVRSSDWIKLGQEIDGNAGDELGISLALSADGMTLAIGVPKSDSNGVDSGQVRVYISSEWSYNSLSSVKPSERQGQITICSTNYN